MALKVKRIKRSLLDELGDGFEALTDADAVEAGFTLADDEVIVVEKPVVTPPPGESADVTDLRTRLHAVNQESAQRRVALKEALTKISAIEAENTTLKGTVGNLKLNEAKRAATTLFDDAVAEKKLVFASDAAGADVRNEIFNSIDWNKEVTKEILVPLVDTYVEKKPYVLKTAQLGSTDGGKQTSPTNDEISIIDLDEVANSFGLPKPVQTKSEGA